MRTCKVCSSALSLDNFYGGRKTCKTCYSLNNKEYTINWRTNNKEQVAKVNSTWYLLNKDNKKNKTNEWRNSNIQHVRQEQRTYCKQKYTNDIFYKIGKNLRSRVRNALKNNQKTGSAIKDLGCSVEELKIYLESRFESGMTWENWSIKGWHIDHIKPLSKFDLSIPKQFKDACHYTNLQPMWAEDNLKKGNKYVN